MRILINALSATNRSSRYVLRRWLERHDRVGDDVVLIIHGSVAEEFADRDPIIVSGLAAAWWSRRIWESRHIPRLVRRHDVQEVIHFGGFPLPDVKVSQTAYLHNPVPFLERTWDRPEARIKPHLQRWAYERLLRYAKRYVVPSVFMRDLVRSRVPGLASEDFVIMPHEMSDDVAAMTHEPRADGTFTLVAAGCWAPHKDLQSTFRILRDMRRNGIDARLIVIGEWAGEAYRRHVMKHRDLDVVRSHVEFVGFLPRPAYLETIRTADLFISTSHAESFGIPAHEAAAMGVPVCHAPVKTQICMTS